MSKPWYQINARGSRSAEILIYGDIGKNWNEESVTAKQFINELKGVSADDLTIRINSIGGSVPDGIAIYNAIKRHPAATRVVVDGLALSIASLIAMAGDTVEMADNALMMIHAPWAAINGNAAGMREAADVLDKHAAAMSSSYANKTGKSSDEVMSWLTDGEDHWFTAEEAKAEGLADVITEALPVVAQFNLNRFKTVPAAAGIFNKPPQQEQPMAATTEPVKPAASDKHTAVPSAEKISADEIKAQVLAAENKRRTDIRSKFNLFHGMNGVAELMAECLDDSNITVQAAVDKLHIKLGEGMEPTAGSFVTRVETGETDGEKFARGVTQAIMARCGKDKHDPQNEFRGMRMEDIARASLERSGRSVKGMDRTSIAKAALAMRPSAAGIGQTTSDFPVLLENVMHKQVLTAYQNTPDTWSRFCKTGSVSDFREWLRLRTGSIGNIESVNERGEYKTKTLPDAAKEGISAKRRGAIISITPEIIINDDIGYINDTTAMLGRSGKRTIESEVYALLAANPVLKDGKSLFHADHGNLAGAGAAPSITTIEAARVAMASQMDIGGNDYLDIRPSVFVGGMATGATAREVNGQEYNDDTSKNQRKPNVVRGLFSDLVDTPRISGNVWYLFADPTVAPVIEVVFLDGQSEPIVAMEEHFASAGVNYRVELPFGVGAIGYEGAYQNPGA